VSAEVALIARWLAFVLASGAAIAGIGAGMARTHFVSVLYLAAAMMLAAMAMLAFGADQAAVALAIAGIAWVPLFLFGGVLLSGKAVRSRARGRWLVTAVAIMSGAVVAWAARDSLPETALAAPQGFGVWLAPLILAPTIVCIGLLGFGERGALERRSRKQ
jgi:hypothetical protein